MARCLCRLSFASAVVLGGWLWAGFDRNFACSASIIDFWILGGHDISHFGFVICPSFYICRRASDGFQVSAMYQAICWYLVLSPATNSVKVQRMRTFGKVTERPQRRLSGTALVVGKWWEAVITKVRVDQALSEASLSNRR